MPCGHVISRESMKLYCENLIDKQKKHEFVCPDPECKQLIKWPYFLVRHVVGLLDTPDEMMRVEQKISENYLNQEKTTRTCPKCHVWCYRTDVTNNCVVCPICTKENGDRRVYFCWVCSRDWRKFFKSGQSCGNEKCDGIDARLSLLERCSLKSIAGRSCPEIRGCPNCGLLIEHEGRCNCLRCTACRRWFCFWCLSGAAETEKELKCGLFARCQIAPRQTLLPR